MQYAKIPVATTLFEDAHDLMPFLDFVFGRFFAAPSAGANYARCERADYFKVVDLVGTVV